MSKLHYLPRATCSTASQLCPFHPTGKLPRNQSDDTIVSERECSKKRLRSSKTFDEIPGPSGLYKIPFIGAALQLKPFTKFSLRNIFELIHSYNKQYGPIVKARMGSDYTVYIYDPDDIEKVFRNDKKYPFRIDLPLTKALEKRTGIPAALGTLKDEEWKNRRRPLQSLVQHPKMIGRYIPYLSDIADEFIQKFENKDEFQDVFHQLMEFTSEGVGFLCFNRRLGHIDQSCSGNPPELLAHTTTYLKHLGEQFFRIPWYKFFYSPIYISFAESYKHIYNFTAEEARKWKKELESDEMQVTEESIGLLKHLLQDGRLQDEKLVTGIVDVFVGGIDSTASALTFLLYHLAKHPEKQQKLYEEVQHITNDRINNDILQNLPYTKACLKESFRLVYPVPGGTMRVLDKDIEIKGYHVQKGTNILLCSGSTCLNDKYFKDPEKFIPERWMRDGTEKPNGFACLPFGYGQRNCLGQRFAESQICVFVAKMLGQYAVSLHKNTDTIPYRYTAFPVPLKPVTLSIRKR